MPDRIDPEIDPEVIETAVLALVEVYGSGRSSLDDAAVEAAIRAAHEKLGLKEERQAEYHREGAERVRYVSDWRPVERGDEDV